jgi:two-component sensor histidine kinase
MQTASDRVVRILIVSIGIGSVLFTVLGLPAIIEQHAFLNPVFSIAMVVAFCGIPPVAALVAFRAPVRVLRILAVGHITASLLLLAFWVPAMTDPTALNDGDLPWLINTVTVATSIAAIALPPIWAWVYLVVVTLTSGVVRFITFGSPDPLQALQDSIMLFILSGFLLALVQLALLAGRQQDAAAALERDAAAAGGQQAAIERRRSRYNAATRDEVVAALELASRNTVESREAAREAAVLTLRKLQAGESLAPVAMTIPIDELDTQLRTAAVAAGVSYAFSQSADDEPLDVPIEVSDALVEATTEAMENSIRHGAHRGGRTTTRSVRASRLPHGVEIIVKDDGPGFNVRRVGVDRLGVRLRILERVNSQPGAAASVDSVRGRGTTVSLEWNEGAK